MQINLTLQTARLALLAAAAGLVAVLLCLVLNGTAAQAQTPSLELAVTTGPDTGEPVHPGELVTFTVVLTYSGAGPVQLRFTDTVSAGGQLAGRPTIQEAAPETVAPLALRVRGQTVAWQGAMRPNATLRIQIPVRVERCWGGARVLRNEAAVLRPDGASLAAAAELKVQCPIATLADIDVQQRVIRSATQPWSSYLPVLLPGRGVTVRTTFRNNAPIPVLLGAGRLHSAGVPAGAALQVVDYLPLQPGEEHSIDQTLQDGARLLNANLLDGDISLDGSLYYCLLAGGERSCPAPSAGGRQQAAGGLNAECEMQNAELENQSHSANSRLPSPDSRLPTSGMQPQHHCPEPGEIPDPTDQVTITIPVRPNDLGDAPDSSNHTGLPMTAYADGTLGTFPTVHAPAPGSPPGPLHRYPLPVHLGPGVSLEAEADSGPDADPTNNLLPGQDAADFDRRDDGLALNQISLAHCQTARLRVGVGANQGAPQALLQRGLQVLYLNVWVDGNRDGDWNDTAPCGLNGPLALEHIVVDHPVAVGQLTPGVNPVSVVSNVPALWLADLATRPAWLRVTLSEERVPKLPGKTYGDGRGPLGGYRLGETEDYRWRPTGGADVSAGQEGQWTWQHALPGGSASALVERVLQFRLTYGNDGSEPAYNVQLTHSIEEFGGPVELDFVRAPGLDSDEIHQGTDSLTFDIGTLAPHEYGTILVGWKKPAGAGAAARAAGTYTAHLVVASANDVDTTDNEARTTLADSLAPLRFAFRTAGSPVLVQRATTCRTAVDLVGWGEPGATIQIGVISARDQGSIGGFQAAGSTSADADGRWSLPLSDLPSGVHVIRAAYAESGRAQALGSQEPTAVVRVAPGLPVDPASFSVTDDSGRTFSPNTLRGQWDDLHLPQVAGSYTVGVNGCRSLDSIQISYSGETEKTLTLADPDGDGRFEGTLVLAAGRATAATALSLQLGISAGGVETVYPISASVSAAGVVRDRASGQPLAGALVTLAATQSFASADGAGVGSTPVDGGFGQANPQTTASDGSYFFAPPAGIYRLVVQRDGYQPYRTAQISGEEGAAVQEVQLAPVIAQEPDLIISIDEDGFSPSPLRIPPGLVIEWANVGLTDHTSTGQGWDSGVLAPGESFRTRFDAEGAFTYTDGQNPLSTGSIVVDAAAPLPGYQQIYLTHVYR